MPVLIQLNKHLSATYFLRKMSLVAFKMETGNGCRRTEGIIATKPNAKSLTLYNFFSSNLQKINKKTQNYFFKQYSINLWFQSK